MKRNYQILLILGAVIAGGAFFTFLMLRETDVWGQAVLIGMSYSVLIVSSLLVVYRFTSVRFSIFSSIPRWILQAISLTVAVSFAYLLGLIIQILILTPGELLMELITDTLWSTFVSLLSAPFTASESTTILSDEVRGLIFTIVAVLFLIGLISLIGSFVEVRWQETRQKVLIDRAEITALRAQMEPHFLFNSLNTIAAMMREDPELAERLILQLSDIMNYHYQYAGAGTVSLQSELEFTHKYIDLITQRYKDKLKIDFVDKVKNRNQKVPVFLLQPLIENAIRHAWKPDGSPLHLQIILEDCHTGTCLSVKDDGVGISEIIQKKIFDINHALGNLNERLRLFYHSSNLISVLSEPDQGTEVLIKIPGD